MKTYCLLILSLALMTFARARQTPGSRELDAGLAAAVLKAIELSPNIPNEWKTLGEAASPFSTSGVARVVLWTRFDALVRTQSGLAGTVPADLACKLWGRAAINALNFLALYPEQTGIDPNAPYGPDGTTRKQAEQAYVGACMGMPSGSTPLSIKARDDMRFILTRKVLV